MIVPGKGAVKNKSDGDGRKPVLVQIHFKSMVGELGLYASDICLAIHISKL